MKPFTDALLALQLLLSLGNCVMAAEIAERDVVYSNGNVQVGGTVISPVAAQAHPAMILMPGSGNQSHTALLDVARAFAGQGIVTLVYDKRGVGKSTGDWTRESLDDLAGDALVGIEFLRTLAGVDAHRIGAWGISQSGWVLPRLARMDPDIAFIICVAGGGATPREVEEFGYRNRLRHAGFTPADWDAAHLLIEQYMRYLATGRDPEALLEAIDAARANKWSSVVDISRVMPEEADRSKWTWVATYDPAKDIQALRMPVLVLLGGNDPFTPASLAMQRWHDGLAIAGNAHDLVISYPTAGHGIRTNGHDMHAAPVYSPGYLQNQFSWLRETGVVP